MTSRRRGFATWCAVVLVGSVLTLWFARPAVDAPLLPDEVLVVEPAAFASPTSTMEAGAEGLLAVGADAAGASILWHDAHPFDAAELPYVAYDMQIDRHDKALLLWRIDGQVSNAEFSGRSGVMDLRRLPSWQGRIDAVGVAIFPTDYLSGQLVRDRLFRVPGLQFEAASWSGAVQALWTGWTAYRPWNGRSNHTGGFALAGGPGASLQAFVAAWLSLGLLVAAAINGVSAVRKAVVPAVALGVAALGLVQLDLLWGRGTVARAASGLAAPHPELPLTAQPQLGAAAVRLVEKLRAEPGRPRVLVYGESLFLAEYPTYLLREHNAATLPNPQALPAAIDGAAFLVLVGPGAWEFDEASGRLTFGSSTRDAELYFDAGVMRAFRLLPAGEGA